MRRHLILAVLAVCLIICTLSGEARAEEGGTYTVDGTFCYRDVDGVLKPIPYARASLKLLDEQEIVMPYGTVENGILTFFTSTNDGQVRYGNYQLSVSFDKVSSAFPLSCGSDGVEISVSEAGEPLGEVEMTLHISIPANAVDGTTGDGLADVSYSLEGGPYIVAGESLPASLNLPWGRRTLALTADDYQRAVYDLCPVMGADGTVSLDGIGDPRALRMMPEGIIVQPRPTDVRYAGGVLTWSARFVAPEGETDRYMRSCELVLKNCETGEEMTSSMSCDYGGSYDIFEYRPDLPSGNYLAKITSLAHPYLTTYDSDPAFLQFYYERPKGYLPDVQGPGWSEDGFPAMTWGYDPDLLKCVKEFHIIPRVAASADGWGRDFVHEYLGDRWQGHLSAAPSQSGVYGIPELLEAMRAYGEGWYTFEVKVVSGSEEWRSSQGWVGDTQPFHYVPDSGDPVRNGTLVSLSGAASVPRVKWTLDNRSRVLTVSVMPGEREELFVASYDEKGRFLGIKDVRKNPALNLSRAGSARMFWMGKAAFDPLAAASNIFGAEN